MGESPFTATAVGGLAGTGAGAVMGSLLVVHSEIMLVSIVKWSRRFVVGGGMIGGLKSDGKDPLSRLD